MKFLKVTIAVLACTGLIFAQMEGTKTEEKSESKTMEKAEKKAASMTASGKVVSVDAAANMIVVKTKKMEDSLMVDANAKILSGKKAVSLGDIKTDAEVTVTWKMMDGKKTATKIVEKMAAKAKKEKY